MGLEVTSPPTTIRLNNLGPVYCHPLERVHGDEDDAGVGIDAVLGISVSDGVEDFERLYEIRLRRCVSVRTGGFVEM
jgi:hypothetical protein